MIYDVVIIGGGQAGLSMGYYLKKTNLTFLILDNHDRVGDVWRERYDSLVLFTPRSYSHLPGLFLDGNQEGFPTKDEIGDYLEKYANVFELPIQLNTEVFQLSKEGELFSIQTNQSDIQARKIVIATGPFHTPRIPSFSKNLSKEMIQLHSSQYKNPTQLNEGPVLIVGGGNSGSQIAYELSNFHETYLSISQDPRFLPISIWGKSIFWWLDKVGILQAHGGSFIGKKFKALGDPIFGLEIKDKIKNQTVKLKKRSIEARQDEVLFEDGSTLKVKNIIWATGFIPNYNWLNIENVIDDNGFIIHERGVSKVEGLYFLGLPWQYRRGSALLLGVGADAEFIYEHIGKNR